MGQKESREPRDWIEHDGYQYATLDGIGHAVARIGGQAAGEPWPLPKDWALAPGTPDIIQNVIGCHAWGTHWIATRAGAFASAGAAANGISKPGQAFPGCVFGSPAARVSNGMCVLDELSFEGFCVRVLIRRPIHPHLTIERLREFDAEKNCSERSNKFTYIKQTLEDADNIWRRVEKSSGRNSRQQSMSFREPTAEERKQLVVPPGLPPSLRIACEGVHLKGWSIWKFPEDFTPLHLAAFLGSVAGVRFLLQASAGVDILKHDEAGKTALQYAQEQGCKDRELLNLLQAPETVTVDAAILPENLDVTLHYACDAVRAKGWSTWQFPENYTPLHLAAALGSVEAVKFLINARADAGLCTKDDLGKTPLDCAKERRHRDPDLIRLLGGKPSRGMTTSCISFCWGFLPGRSSKVGQSA